MCANRSLRRGFTLIEALTVVAILSLLLTMLLPSFVRIREMARRRACAANVKTLSVAMLLYSNGNNGRVPLTYLHLNGDSVNRQFDYLVMWNFQNYPNPDMAYGLLATELTNRKIYEANQVFKAFYCPSQTAQLFKYNNFINPWFPPPLGLEIQPELLHASRLRHAAAGRLEQPHTLSVNWLGEPIRPQSPATGQAGPQLFHRRGHRDRHGVHRLQPRGRREVQPQRGQRPRGLPGPTGGVNFATASGAVKWFDTINFNSTWQSWGQQTLKAINTNDWGFQRLPLGAIRTRRPGSTRKPPRRPKGTASGSTWIRRSEPPLLGRVRVAQRY